MSSFLTRLGERTLGLAPVAKARPLSRYEQEPVTAPAAPEVSPDRHEETVAAQPVAAERSPAAASPPVPAAPRPATARPEPAAPVRAIETPPVSAPPPRITATPARMDSVTPRRADPPPSNPEPVAATFRPAQPSRIDARAARSSESPNRASADTRIGQTVPERRSPPDRPDRQADANPQTRHTVAPQPSAAPHSATAAPTIHGSESEPASTLRPIVPAVAKEMRHAFDVQRNRVTPMVPARTPPAERAAPAGPATALSTHAQPEPRRDAPPNIVIGRIDVRMPPPEARQPPAPAAGLRHVPSLASCLARKPG